MTKNDVYIYYSGATDKTGKALQAALKIDGGTNKPRGKKKVIIGWGAKTKESVTISADSILNHPNEIKLNRNKLATLAVLKRAKVNVAGFVPADSVTAALTSGKLVSYPVVGRTKYHQGGSGFWTCLDKGMVAEAIKEGAQYFQNRISIQDEFRLHIFNGVLLYAQKKVKRENTAKAFIDQQKGKIENAATRGDTKLDKKTMDFILARQSKEQAEHADMLIRSNTRGWRFAHVKNTNVKDNLLQQAKAALAAMNLQFGAVDCCVDIDGKAWIIEINSGPGLEGTPFDAYVAAFKDAISKVLSPKKVAAKKTTTAAKVVNTAETESTKSSLQQKLALFQEMVDVADDEEAEALSKVASKMFGK